MATLNLASEKILAIKSAAGATLNITLPGGGTYTCAPGEVFATSFDSIEVTGAVAIMRNGKNLGKDNLQVFVVDEVRVL